MGRVKLLEKLLVLCYIFVLCVDVSTMAFFLKLTIILASGNLAFSRGGNGPKFYGLEPVRAESLRARAGPRAEGHSPKANKNTPNI